VGGGRTPIIVHSLLIGSGAGVFSPQHTGRWCGCWLVLGSKGTTRSTKNTVEQSVATRSMTNLPIAPPSVQSNLIQSYLQTADGGFEETDAPCTIPFPSTFRLERTNFVATPSSPGEALSVESLLDALRSALSGAGVDVLEFKPAHCVVS